MALLNTLVQFLAAGLLAGLMAGLFGVGGGLVLVPVLIVMLADRVPSVQLMQYVIATSLAAIVFSVASSAFRHWRRNSVDVQLWRRLLPTLIAGSTAGALGAAYAPRALLLGYVAVLQAVLCVYLMRKTFVASAIVLARRAPSHALMGMLGALCAVAGISIGTLAVTYLRRQNVAPHVAVGTAAALGIPVALTGAVVLAISGYWQAAAAPWSAGFVYLPALLGLIPGVVTGAQAGAALAHRCAPRVLMSLFCVFLAAMSVRSIAALAA